MFEGLGGACGVAYVAVAVVGADGGGPGVVPIALDLLAVVLRGATNLGDLLLLDHHQLSLLVCGLLHLLQGLDLLLQREREQGGQ